MIAAILAVVTATYAPPAPTVGDLITVEFTADVRLDASERYEIIAEEGSRAVVRTFEPAPFLLSGRVGSVGFRGLPIVVRSVLRPEDDLAPAPLSPPLPVPYAREPFIAMGVAAATLLAAWTSVWWLTRPRTMRPVVVLAPDERFRRAVLALIGQRDGNLRWATLADETRLYLAATRPELGSELTTRELLRRVEGEDRVVEEILRQGDLEKFSLRGAAPADFDSVARRAVALAERDRESQATTADGGAT